MIVFQETDYEAEDGEALQYLFRRQVIEDVENGRFESVAKTRQYYDIVGNAAVQRWLRSYGKTIEHQK